LDIKDNKFNIGEIFNDDKVIRAVYWEYIDLGIVIVEVEVKLALETKTVIGIKTLLDTMFITLQNIREVGQRTTLVLNKGKRL